MQKLSRAFSKLEYFEEGIIIRSDYSKNKDAGKEIIIETGAVCAEWGASRERCSFSEQLCKIYQGRCPIWSTLEKKCLYGPIKVRTRMLGRK